ncbi:MAG: ketopantoate reductase family protein [Azospirillaceae bacterium]
MRIAVMGAGGVGGYFGGRLSAAGHDVAFVARGAHLAALRRDGLRIASEAGDLHLPAVTVTDDPAGLAEWRADTGVPPAVVVVAVKLADTEAAGAAIAPLVGPETVVLSLQNGVDGPALLARHVPASAIRAGAAYISAFVDPPGTIRQTGRHARLVLGEPGGGAAPWLDAFAKAVRAAGGEVRIAGDIEAELWAKFAMLAPFAALTAATGHSAGVIRADPETRALFAEAVAEVVAVARARGVALPQDVETRILGDLDRLPEAMIASMAHDRARGAPLELPWLSGTVARLGAEAGVPTPVHRVLAATLAPDVAGKG